MKEALWDRSSFDGLPQHCLTAFPYGSLQTPGLMPRSNSGTRGLDITDWLDWLLRYSDRTLDGTEEVLGNVMHRTCYWDAVAGETFSERQRAVINRMLDSFEGKLTSSKWAKLARVSSDTAFRDITNPVDRGLLEKEGGATEP